VSFRVTVVGTGYLGVTHAACMAESGFDVVGVDVSETKVAALAAGSIPFHEPGLGDIVRRHVDSGRLRFTTSLAEAGASGDVHFLCVGTPQQSGGLGADLRQVEAALTGLAPHLGRQSLVVGKSTVPVGTAERLWSQLESLSAPHDQIDLAWNPEFLREGHAVEDTLRPDRIVVGVRSGMAEKILREIYSVQIESGVPFLPMDLTTAELVKVAANSFLATKLSFINAMAELCERTGADVTALADAIGHDPRIGRRYLSAGLGFGGGCLPKDIRAFIARAEELGVSDAVSFLRQVDAINGRRRARVVDLTRQECGGDLTGRRIAVLGAAFKPDSDDIRDSPALDVAERLRLAGARVCVYDPAAMDNARRAFPALEYAASLTTVVTGAQVLLHLTDWNEFVTLDPHRINGRVSGRIIIDGRNCLDAERWRLAGWTYRALGRR
jgi:UDPglucose 6-dehydrogenase